MTTHQPKAHPDLPLRPLPSFDPEPYWPHPKETFYGFLDKLAEIKEKGGNASDRLGVIDAWIGWLHGERARIQVEELGARSGKKPKRP